MEQHEILRSLSEIAIAITGFSGIVAALMHRSVTNVDLSDRVSLSTLLGTSLGVALFGYMPDLTRAAFESETTAWRVAVFLFATFHLGSLAGALKNRKRVLHSELGQAGLPPTLMQVPAFTAGFLICVLQLSVAIGFLEGWLFFAYLLGMLWILFVAAWMFCDRLMTGLGAGPDA